MGACKLVPGQSHLSNVQTSSHILVNSLIEDVSHTPFTVHVASCVRNTANSMCFIVNKIYT